jgi:hypothetical protein
MTIIQIKTRSQFSNMLRVRVRYAIWKRGLATRVRLPRREENRCPLVAGPRLAFGLPRKRQARSCTDCPME